MNPKLFGIFVLLFAGIFVPAISSNDAVNFVANSNHFLYDSETYTPPNVTIGYGEVAYWVIPLTAGNAIITYFPISAETGELSVSNGINRGLFTVADSLRELQLLKASVSANPGVDWVFTQKYETLFSELSIKLNSEVFQLNTVESTLESEGISADLSSLKRGLVSMSSKSLEVASLVNKASAFENAFVTKPSEKSFDEMNAAFEKVYDAISELNSKNLEYSTELNKLNLKISTADLDAQTKSQLFSILSPPQELQSVRSYNLDASQVKSSFEAALKDSNLRMDSLLDELDTRIQKNEVFGLIYGDNADLEKATKFSSLYEAQKNILGENFKPLWKNQKDVKALEQDYSKALRYNSERNFSQAKKYALSAITSAKKVVENGLEEKPVSGPVFSQDTLFLAGGVLIVLLIILVAFNNKKRISEMAFGADEEIDVYEK